MIYVIFGKLVVNMTFVMHGSHIPGYNEPCILAA